jgi:glycine reductase complex component B subunit gamma
VTVTRVVHYLNQFFAGAGGEDAAGAGPSRVDGPVGPGRRLQELLGPGFEIVATVSCGDDWAATTPGAADAIVALAAEASPAVLVAGPAFTSGRYGLACARVVAAAAAAGIPAVASMHEDNPGLDEAGGVPVVASGPVARHMAASLDALAPAVRAVAAGEPVVDNRIGKVPRLARLADDNAAERAVRLLLARIGGDTATTEVPLPRFDAVTPAAPVVDPSTALVALVTEGGLVPDDNPDGLESARASKWLRYSFDDAGLGAGRQRSVHGGFSTVAANEDPNRIVPLDTARHLVEQGAIGRLHGEWLVTTGNGTSVGNARRFGVEWAGELRRLGVQAALLTAT